MLDVIGDTIGLIGTSLGTLWAALKLKDRWKR